MPIPSSSIIDVSKQRPPASIAAASFKSTIIDEEETRRIREEKSMQIRKDKRHDISKFRRSRQSSDNESVSSKLTFTGLQIAKRDEMIRKTDALIENTQLIFNLNEKEVERAVEYFRRLLSLGKHGSNLFLFLENICCLFFAFCLNIVAIISAHLLI
jgi:hypothetical protein